MTGTTPIVDGEARVAARAKPVTGQARQAIARAMQSDAWVLGVAVLYFLVLLPFVPDLANVENLQNLLSNVLPLLAVAIGQTFVLVTGGIDLSATSIVALASVTGAWTMTGPLAGTTPWLAVPAGLVAMLAAGAVVGVGNGVAITRLKMPPFMVTLATMLFVSGFAIWATKSKGIYGLPDAFDELAQGTLAFVPLALVPVALVALLAHVLLARSLFGRRLFAIGLNPKAALISGVPVARTTVLAYVASGMCAAIGGALYTGRLETGSPVLGQRIFLDVIGAAVIGGTSLFGGKGSVPGTLWGVLFITLIDNSLNLMGLSNFTVLMAKGTVILLAALFDAVRTRSRAGQASSGAST